MSEVILVTDAVSEIGRMAVERLREQNVLVRALVHSIGQATHLRHPRVELAEVDLNKQASVNRVFDGAHRALLITSVTPDLAAHGKRLVAAAKKAKLQHLVRISTLGAGAPKPAEYCSWHATIDRAVERSAIPYTILRPNFFMQNFVNHASPSIRQQGVFYFPTGDGKTSYVDAGDVADAACALFSRDGHENRTFDLTGPEALSNSIAAYTISEVIGRRINFIDIPEDLAQKALEATGMPEWCVRMLLQQMGMQKNGEASTVSPAIQQILGRKPTSFRNFVEANRIVFQ